MSKKATKKELKNSINTIAGIVFWLSVVLFYLAIWVDGYHLKYAATAILTFLISLWLEYIASTVIKSKNKTN
ncbi:hypothetical protein GQ473_01430 [archaeon]|nr:hypothetical protein [archaeon]